MASFDFGSSPVSKPELFAASASAGARVMTVGGAVNATLILTGICVCSAIGGWELVQASPGIGMIAVLGGLVLAALCSIAMIFKPSASPYVAPVHAVCEGLFVGAISLVYAMQAKGTKFGGVTGTSIVLSASMLTFAVLAAMLLLYKARIINATAKFKAVMLAVGLGIGIFSLVMLGMSLFGADVSWAYRSGPVALAIQGGIAIYAAFLLIIDFDRIEQGALSSAPRYMEWYSGHMLLTTLVWLYVQFLRILSILNKRD